MVRHPHVQAWELRLRQVFERIDEELEREYGTLYPLHPARPPHGATASREDDGLFDVGAAFSAGFGSAHGAGYVVEVRMVTLSRVPAGVRERIEASVIKEMILLNTIPIPPEKMLSKIKVLSVAPLFAEAMIRIFTNDSISRLFDE